TARPRQRAERAERVRPRPARARAGSGLPRALARPPPRPRAHITARELTTTGRAYVWPRGLCDATRDHVSVPFSSVVAEWFGERFGTPTPAQDAGWPRIAAGDDTLIAAPTGSGKTLAAFLWSIDKLVRLATAGQLEDRTHVVYVSPLKALGNDVQKNLLAPLAELRARAEAAGTPLPEIRVMVRSGDTPASERQAMLRRPPHILITTPE